MLYCVGGFWCPSDILLYVMCHLQILSAFISLYCIENLNMRWDYILYAIIQQQKQEQ